VCLDVECYDVVFDVEQQQLTSSKKFGSIGCYLDGSLQYMLAGLF